MELKGLRLDGKFADSAQNTWAYAKNILISKGFDEIENEPGETSLNTTISGTIVGRITTPEYLFLFVWETSKCYIKRYDCVAGADYVDLIQNGTTYININPSQTGIFIEGVYCYNAQNELIIAWTDGINKPMILNTTEAATSPLNISSESDLKLLYLFPEFTSNNFSATNVSATTDATILNNGKLPSAAYFFSLTYEIEQGINTNFGVISNPIFITDGDILTSYKQHQGNGSGVITNKAINLTLANLDTSYTFCRIAVIKRTYDSIDCYLTKRVKITTSPTILIDDLDKLELFSISEVLTSAPAYKTIKSMTVSNNRLRLFNCTKYTKLSLANIYDNLFAPRTVSILSATRSGTTVYILTTTSHSASTGDNILMEGWNVTAYNGYFSITVTGVDTFTYTTSTSATDSSFGGTCKIERVSVNWINEYTASLTSSKDSYKDSIFTFNKRGFRENEVYALYLGLKLKTGGYYGIYHIPGRNPLSGETTAQTTIDGTATDNYKFASTAIKLGNYYGKMGAWENENETYPSTYGTTLSGQKVRHHRFPSAGQINTWKTGVLHHSPTGSILQTINFSVPDKYTEGSDRYYGILGNINPSIGTFTPASATGYDYNKYEATYNQIISLNADFFCYVDSYGGGNGRSRLIVTKYTKTVGGYTSSTLYDHETIADNPGEQKLAEMYTNSSITLLAGDYILIEIYIITGATGYFGIATGNTTPYIIVYEATTTHEVLGLQVRFNWDNVGSAIKSSIEADVNGWEIFYAKRTLNNQLIIDQSIAFTEGSGFRWYGFDSIANTLDIEPTHAMSELYVNTPDYSAGTFITEVNNYTADSATKIRKITKIKYLPAYNSATVPNNEDKENCYYFETATETFNLRLVNLINVKDNVYLDFSNQELVSTGRVNTLASQSLSLYGGDTYIGHNSILRYEAGIHKIYYFPIQSILNSTLRYEGENDYEKFYPLTDITVDDGASPLAYPYIDAMKDAGIANYYIINNDFHLLNTLRQDVIDTEFTSLDNTFPNRIVSSYSQPEEANVMYWKKYKVLDYFDMVNNKGSIFKAIASNRIVYIQTTYSIYRGVIVDQLKADNIDIALKSIDIFDRPLEELFDADGSYIKPYNKEGMIITPYGLVVADLDKGAIYVINDKANEITRLGIADWFRTTVRTTMTYAVSSPYDKEAPGVGVALGYDDLNKRLLVTVNNYNTATISPITLSFNFETMYWVAFHTYTPAKYCWNVNGLFMFKGNDVFKLLSGNYGYYNTTYHNSVIDFIFNSNKSDRFLLKNVKWVTNLEASGINYWDSTITKLMVYSKNQCTGEVTIVRNYYGYDGNGIITEQANANCIYQDGTWIFNDIKDMMSTPNAAILDNNFDVVTASLNLLKNWYEMSKFISKFVIVRMLYTNTSANRKLRITNIDIEAKNILQ